MGARTEGSNAAVLQQRAIAAVNPEHAPRHPSEDSSQKFYDIRISRGYDHLQTCLIQGFVSKWISFHYVQMRRL